MNIPKLFETQRLLNSHIDEKHPAQIKEARLTDKVLALSAELMECANEWRGFKFWSNDRAPRNKCMKCQFTETPHECRIPLLEEFVDCLHLIISIGLDFNVSPDELFVPSSTKVTSSNMFISIQRDVLDLHFYNKQTPTLEDLERRETLCKLTFIRILELGITFGFTVEQIEAAYYSKNKINHARQDNHY